MRVDLHERKKVHCFQIRQLSWLELLVSSKLSKIIYKFPRSITRSFAHNTIDNFVMYFSL